MARLGETTKAEDRSPAFSLLGILAVLRRAVTPEAVREVVDRLTRADRMAGFPGDVGWRE